MRSVGRPRKTPKEWLDKGWQDTVIELMTEGGSKAEVIAILNISNDLHYRWMSDEEEYSETIKKGEVLSQGWWEKHARNAATGVNKDANATMMIFNLKNRFPNDWRDKTEREHSGNIGITDLSEDALDQKLQQLEQALEQSAKT